MGSQGRDKRGKLTRQGRARAAFERMGPMDRLGTGLDVLRGGPISETRRIERRAGRRGAMQRRPGGPIERRK